MYRKKSLGHFQPPDLRQVYGFIRLHACSWPVHTRCAALQVSRSAYYGWLSASEVVDKREEETERLVLEAFREHRRRYGVRRLVAELKGRGIEIGAFRVRQTLVKHGVKAIQPRSFALRTTDSRHLIPSTQTCCRTLPSPPTLTRCGWATSPTSS